MVYNHSNAFKQQSIPEGEKRERDRKKRGLSKAHLLKIIQKWAPRFQEKTGFHSNTKFNLFKFEGKK